MGIHVSTKPCEMPKAGRVPEKFPKHIGLYGDEEKTRLTDEQISQEDPLTPTHYSCILPKNMLCDIWQVKCKPLQYLIVNDLRTL